MNNSVINTKTRRSYLAHHKKCFYCGKRATTIDHIIPRQVFEMTVDYEDEYRDCVRDRENWRPSCKQCNTKRLAHFDVKDVPHFLRSKYSHFIDTYIDARKRILEGQNGKCLKCGKELIEEDAVLMYKRKAVSSKLTQENCIVICYNCDEVNKCKKE